MHLPPAPHLPGEPSWLQRENFPSLWTRLRAPSTASCPEHEGHCDASKWLLGSRLELTRSSQELMAIVAPQACPTHLSQTPPRITPFPSPQEACLLSPRTAF